MKFVPGEKVLYYGYKGTFITYLDPDKYSKDCVLSLDHVEYGKYYALVQSNKVKPRVQPFEVGKTYRTVAHSARRFEVVAIKEGSAVVWVTNVEYSAQNGYSATIHPDYRKNYEEVC